MSLPQEKRKRIHDLSSQTIVVYGMPKIGKSTFCSHFESPLFISTEPGLNALEVYDAPVSTWDEFLGLCKELADDKSRRFRNIIIDTADNLYGFCETHVLAQNKVSHPSDMAYGKGYALIQSEFGRVIKKLSMLGFGLVFVSHAKVREEDTRIGKIQKTTLSLPEGARKEILKMTDMILFCDMDRVKDGNGNLTEKRVIRTRASGCYDAGTRWELPDTIELSFAAFSEAYSKSTPRTDANAKPAPVTVIASASATTVSTTKTINTVKK